MPRSAMPEWIQDQAEGTGTDWDNGIQKKLHKSWFAYGPRATEWWAKWREWPRTIVAIFGAGQVRFETERRDKDSGSDFCSFPASSHSLLNRDFPDSYISRIQYYCRWSLQIQWPFMIAAHRYDSPIDVPMYPDNRPDTDGKLWFFYLGAHRDADKVYWFPSAYLGRNWK